MANITVQGPRFVDISGSRLGTALQTLLMADDIAPGAPPSYELCKQIYLYHPLGAKIAEKPIEIAQSQQRKINVADSPEEMVRDRFLEQWRKDLCDRHIFNTMSQSRVYGICTVALREEGKKNSAPLDFQELWRKKITISVYDPLNTAGSLVLEQDPLSMDFQHVRNVAVNGEAFHRSRTVTMMNENPIYLAWNSAGFGFNGRSVYQRALFPLKSFIQTMITDDLVSVKLGVIVAKIKQAGSVVSGAMQKLFGGKRNVVKEAVTGNVISIGTDGEEIASLDFTNMDGPMERVRKNIIENIASAVPMPAKMLTEESFAEGFGEGTEDAKNIARYVDRIREQMQPLYDFFDKVTMYRAWSPDFYAILQEAFPEYKGVPYEQAFYEWCNSFVAEWPSLLKEPDSELSKIEKVKLEAVIEMLNVLLPLLDPENKAILLEWASDTFNELRLLFPSPLHLDYDVISKHMGEEADRKEEERQIGLFGNEDEDKKDIKSAKDAIRLIRGRLSLLELAHDSKPPRRHRMRVA